MHGVTLEQAIENRDIWINASTAVASGQSYTIGRRSLTRANLSEIKSMIDYWNTIISKLKNGRGPGARVLRVVPVDL